ncbi:diacylglycerol kinase [Methylosarcina fibrata]|uniref:diacylglycerol kinase n=1 Tax=Methylosarcina fibrata TaxID=105972 RepID=UPI00036370C2|nr:diacylglycerol kinase [Methylosarcina fibrata]
MKGQPFSKRLTFALRGLSLAFRRERSLRFQTLAGTAVLLVLSITRPAPLWWAVGALTIGLVMMAELMNAALETLADRLHPERHPEIGAAKDMAAGAVLAASVTAVLVAIAFIFR